MLRKTCELADFKMIEEGHGSLSGYGSTHGSRDRAGEIVVKGAFNKSLENFKSAGFIAIGHEWSDLPVATVADAYEDEKGLFVKGEFHSSDAAQKARTYVRERLERGKSVGLSIGYTVKDSERTKDGLLLKEIDLFEVSIVTVPCNPHANATGVKALDDEASAWSLGALEDQCDALFGSQIYPLLFDGNSSDSERLAAADAVLAEFSKGAGLALRAALLSAPDDDAKSELEAEFKAIFSPPARIAGRLAEQVKGVQVALDDIIGRHEALLPLRHEQGRSFPEERWASLSAIKSRLEALLSARVTEQKPALDATLLQLQAEFEATRLRTLLALGGA